MKEIVAVARRRKILKQVEKADPQTGECWQLLRVLGKGEKIPETHLKNGDSYVLTTKGRWS